MDKSLLSPLTSFKDQFTFVPNIINSEALHDYTQVVICGMGGSAISVSLLKLLFPELPVTLHNSYGLPANYNKETTLFILNSYSGNTEEVLDAYDRVKKDGAKCAVLSKGGALIVKAASFRDAHVIIPESTLEPRFSIGYQIIGILTLLNEHEKINTLRERIPLVNIEKVTKVGQVLADTFKNKYPVLYASSSLHPVAYLIKAAINEGSKIPCFVSQVPEANHNELQSFVTSDTISEKDHFGFCFITSIFEHIRISKRVDVMQRLYEEHGFVTYKLATDHTNIVSIFETLLTGYYMATYMAINKNVDPYTTPLIAEFKNRMTQ